MRERLSELANEARARVPRRPEPDVGQPAVDEPLVPDVPRPVPEGSTEDGIRKVMASIRIDDAPAGELAGYLGEAFWRFLHTWGLVPQQTGWVLELGANPYFLTWLLKEHTELDVELANYFGGELGSLDQGVTFTDEDGDEVRWMLTSALFNMEVDRFPYE